MKRSSSVLQLKQIYCVVTLLLQILAIQKYVFHVHLIAPFFFPPVPMQRLISLYKPDVNTFILPLFSFPYLFLHRDIISIRWHF